MIDIDYLLRVERKVVLDIEQIEKFFNLFQEEIKKIVDYEQIEIPEDKIVSGFVDIKKENSEK